MSEYNKLVTNTCNDCRYAIRLEDLLFSTGLIECPNSVSDHYGHVLSEYHPACEQIAMRFP